MRNRIVNNLIEFIRFMIKQLDGSTLVRRKVILNMDRESISLKKKAHIMKDNGGIIRWKARVKPILGRGSCSTQASGKPMNTMVGVCCIPIHRPMLNGSPMKGSSRTG